jgi:hypothetical protein
MIRVSDSRSDVDNLKGDNVDNFLRCHHFPAALSALEPPLAPSLSGPILRSNHVDNSALDVENVWGDCAGCGGRW